MKRLIGRPAHTQGLERRVPAMAIGRNWLILSCLALLCAVTANVYAQDNSEPTVSPPPSTLPGAPSNAEVQTDPQRDLMTVVEPKYERDPTSISPLGDDFNPATGTVTFSATDISLPGNFAIPVELRRWVTSDDANTGGPVGWKWNIPFIRGNFLDVRDGHDSTGWNWGNPDTWRYGKNCTGSADSVIDNAGHKILPSAFWQGKLLHIPGVTSETFLTKASGEQVTKSHFKISACIDNPSGQQGIVVKGPDGTIYTFNQVKTYFNGKQTLKGPIIRTRLLMITQIEDRFGNTVDYKYDQDTGKLTGI